MPIHPRRPRSGRILDWIIIAICSAIFIGLGAFHYRRLDRSETNDERVKELTEQKLIEPKPIDPKVATHDWPQWRGPNRDGVSTETGLLAEWPKDGPPKLWEAKIGEGYSTVSVSNGRVYTIFQDGPNESIICWNEADGKEQWRFSYECAYTNNYGNGPRSTPSIDGNLVYAVGAKGDMHCLTADKGKLVWSKKLLEEFNAEIPRWGVSFSPFVEGDRVFIVPGGTAGHGFAALDKKTGAVLWQKHNDMASYSSPVGATIHGERQIIFFAGTRVIGVTLEAGDLLWEYPWPIENELNIATPLVVNDYVFISSSYARGAAVLKIAKTGNAWHATQVYKTNWMRNHFASSVRHKDHLYGFDDSTLVCMNFQTGKIAWKQRGFDKGSVALAGDQLYVYGANGILALADADPKEYTERASFRFTQQDRTCWSVPVIANGRLYVRDLEKLVCFDIRK